MKVYNQRKHRPSAERVYRALDTSRQAVKQFWQRYHRMMEQLLLSERELQNRRIGHPRLGLKKAYYMIAPADIGRDRFVKYMTLWGHALSIKRSYIRTTSSGSYRYPNLIKGLFINYINRVWQSDTTYYRLANGAFVYLTFIIDVYSRVIVGHCCSESLDSRANVKALEMALKSRKGQNLSELIFHSDGATQYRSGRFVAVLTKHGISSSMCKVALDNAYAEKLNDIIKGEYLEGLAVDSLSKMNHHLPRVIRNYNKRRHHGLLPVRLAPMEYERYLAEYPQGHIPLLIKDGQAKRVEFQPGAAHDLVDAPTSWVSGRVDKIMPAFVKLNLPKENSQFVLAL